MVLNNKIQLHKLEDLKVIHASGSIPSKNSKVCSEGLWKRGLYQKKHGAGELLAKYKNYFRASLVFSGKESTCQCKKREFDPWSGKIPHALEQLNLWATSVKPVLWSLGSKTTAPTYYDCWSPWALDPVPCKERSHRSEKLPHHG